MLRLLLLILLIAPLAQAQVPDTTDAARYAPLAVGNEWHYEERIKPGWELYRIQIWRILSDSLINDEQCFLFERRRYDPSGQPWHVLPQSFSYVRFDAEADNLRVCGDEGVEPWEYLPWCPLSADFDTEILCEDSFEVWVGSPGSVVTIGQVQVQATVKDFDTGGSESIHVFAADLGLVEYSYWLEHMLLTYVRAGDQEYGNPFVVSIEPAALTPGTLSVFPNPATSEAVVRFYMEEPQAARIEVIDLLGRRVDARPLGVVAAGDHEVVLHLASLPTGVYFLRLVGDGAVGATARLTITR